MLSTWATWRSHHHERALENRPSHLRPNHPTMATFRDNLDHALQQLGGEERKGDW